MPCRFLYQRHNSMNKRSLSDACSVCGLCCDGTLFDSVNDDIQGRCPALRNGCCSVYNDRPKECRTFVCRLGRYYESGQVSLEFVRQRAEEMEALTEEIICLFPQGLIDELDEKGEIRTSARWYLSVFSQYALSHSSFTGMSPQTALRLVGLSHDYFSQFYEFWDREFENETNWKKRSGKKETL